MKANKGFYIQGVLAGLLLFLLAAPYYMWEHESLGYFLRLVYGGILLINYRKGKDSFSVVWVFLLVYLSIAAGSSIIAFLLFIFSNIFLLSAKPEFRKVAYQSFYFIFVAFAVLSSINYILFLLGIPLPSREIAPLNDLKDYNYIAYPFMVLSNDIKDLIRFRGLFDEPGAMATYCFLFLWAEKFNLAKWSNVVLMVAGFFTLSLFFYVAIGVVMIVKIFSKGTSIWFRVVSISLIAIFSYSLTIEDSITSIAIGDRLEYDEEKGFSGNNRSNQYTDMYYDQVRWKDPLFFWGPTLSGVDKAKVASQVEGSAGYKNAILLNGLFSCLFYVLFFLLYARKAMKKKRDYFLFIICFFMTLYQRPFLTDIVYLFLFVSIIKLQENQPDLARDGTLLK